MPKIGLPKDVSNKADVDVTKDSIESLVQQIDALLEGNIDIDNVAMSDSNYAHVSHKTVQDIAGSTRPIGGDKIFANHLDLDKFETRIITPYINAMHDSHEFITVSKKKQFSFVNDGDGNVVPIQSLLSIEIDLATNVRPVHTSIFNNVSTNAIDGGSVKVESEFYNMIVRTDFAYSLELSKGETPGTFTRSENNSDYRLIMYPLHASFNNNTLTLYYKLEPFMLKLSDNKFLTILLEPTVLCEVML